MSVFTWIQLTDLHLGHAGTTRFLPAITAEFGKDVVEMSKRIGVPDAVLLTGDIAYSGARTEYLKAAELLSWLENDVLGRQFHVIAAPGNHDLQRPAADSDIEYDWLHYYDSKANAGRRHSLWTSGESLERNSINSMFTEFSKFFETHVRVRLPTSLLRGTLAGDSRTTLRFGQLEVGVVCLNSAWRHIRDIKPGTLTIEPDQLQALIGPGAPSLKEAHHLSILLQHHPPSWLGNRREWARRVAPEFDLVLCGHLHRSDFGHQRSMKDPGIASIQAMSLCGVDRYGDTHESRRFGYCWGQAILAGGRIDTRVWHRELRQDGCWRFDHSKAAGSSYSESEGLLVRSMEVRETVRPSSAARPVAEEAQGIVSVVDAIRELPPWPSSFLRGAVARLAELQTVRIDLLRRGGPIEQIDSEILSLRRSLRDGPTLRRGRDLLGRYILMDVVGEGGFGTVWKAWDQEEGGLVAIKVLHGQYAHDFSKRERLFRGAAKMKSLEHPNVVRVLRESGSDGGHHFYVMEYVDGPNLAQAVKDGTIRGAAAFRALLDIADAVAFAHSRGLIHRDIKPENILVALDGAKLTDFDFVLAAGTLGRSRRTGMVGTLMFAAPEALEDASSADERADIYSIGMTLLWAAWCGDLPLTLGMNPESALRERTLSRDLSELIARATAVDVRQRWPTARSMCVALRNLVEVEFASAKATSSDVLPSQFSEQAETDARATQYRVALAVSPPDGVFHQRIGGLWGLVDLRGSRPSDVARSRGQAGAIAAILGDFQVVFITGPTGVGKTFAALWSAVEMMTRHRRFGRVRYRVPQGGRFASTWFLPIDGDAATGAVMGGVLPVLESVWERQGWGAYAAPTGRVRVNPDAAAAWAALEVGPLWYEDGATERKSVVVVDGAHDLSTSVIARLLSSAGEDSKFVFVADLDSRVRGPEESADCGLVVMARKLLASSSVRAVHVRLDEVVASVLAAEGARLL